ncbi:MAG: hypothetical protein Q7S39_10845 [Ignavibacteria bacterium]|nr:hypothetical protein [Ignavibacteria bacterium]
MKYLLLLFILLITSGCERKENAVSSEKNNAVVIKNLVSQAIDSNAVANNKLANLIDYSLPVMNNYNSIIVDSIIADNKTYYYVLLENPNPLYNKFAVYDSLLMPLLIDKSLNGNIFLEKINTNGEEFIKVEEAYLSKDTLVLNRLSLYLADASGVSLVFRTHTKFAKPEIEYFQDIIEISDTLTLIKTRISSSEKSDLNNKEDNFSYDPSTRKYLSTQNLFDEFIKKEIESFNYKPGKEQLIDPNLLK